MGGLPLPGPRTFIHNVRVNIIQLIFICNACITRSKSRCVDIYDLYICIYIYIYIVIDI